MLQKYDLQRITSLLQYSSFKDQGPESVASGGSRTTLGSIGSLESTDSSSNDTSTPVEMSDEWSSAKSGPGALCLKNSSSRRAAFQVRYIDGQTNQANQTQRSSLMKDVLATPDGGILEAGASMDVEVLLAAHGLRQGEEAELTVRDDRLLITALWFDDNVDLEALSVTELEAALSKLWKEKLGSSKRYRVRIALSEMVLVPLEEETRGANSVGGGGGVGGSSGTMPFGVLEAGHNRDHPSDAADAADAASATSSSSNNEHETSTVVSSQSQLSVATSSVLIGGTAKLRDKSKHHGISRIANRRKTAMRRPRKAVIGAKGSPHQEDNRYAITVRSYRKGHMLTADGAQVVAQLLDSHTRHRYREETRSRQRTTHTRPPDEDITRD